MANNSRVNELRAQARRLEANFASKASRLRKKGIELTGSEFDLRKGSAIGKMRSRDLEVHNRRLQELNSRRSVFMQTRDGIAGPAEVNRYRAAVRQTNQERRQMLKKYGSVQMPNSDETMSQKWGVREAAQRRMNDPSLSNPFKELTNDAIQFGSRDALAKMAQRLEDALTPQAKNKKRDNNRDTLKKMFSKVPMPELENIIFGYTDAEGNEHAGMTDEQFDLMWFHPDFMTSEGFIYEQVATTDRDSLDPSQLSIMDDRISNEAEEVMAIAKWAIQ